MAKSEDQQKQELHLFMHTILGMSNQYSRQIDNLDPAICIAIIAFIVGIRAGITDVASARKVCELLANDFGLMDQVAHKILEVVE